MRPNTRMVVVNFPHNPTGFIPTRAEFSEIVELCRQYGAYLFCDEMYRLLEFDTAHRLPAAVDAYEKVQLAVLAGTFDAGACVFVLGESRFRATFRCTYEMVRQGVLAVNMMWVLLFSLLQVIEVLDYFQCTYE